MWEATSETRTSVPPDRIWALWEDSSRWRDWHPQIAEASLDGPFAVGSTARIRFKRSPSKLRFTITALEPGRLFVDESRLPGGRMGHEHRIEPSGDESIIRHRVYIDGPLTFLYAALLGRQIRTSVKEFGPLEVELSNES